MSDELNELTRRISAAFDRMDQGLEVLARKTSKLPEVEAAEGEASAATPALLRALESAKASSDEWAERYRILQAQMSAETLAMAAEIARLTTELTAARAGATTAPAGTSDIDELTTRIAEQEAELESLRAERASDAAELAEIIAALDPLVQEARHV